MCVIRLCFLHAFINHRFQAVNPFTKFNCASVIDPRKNIIRVDVRGIFRDDLGLQVIKTENYILCDKEVVQDSAINFIIDFVRCGEFSGVDIKCVCFFTDNLKFGRGSNL